VRILLISTYELGRQPFGLASPAAWLRKAGFVVDLLDLAQCRLDEAIVRSSDLIAFYLPMHTATRIALRALPRVKTLNPRAHLAAFGLYAPMNAPLLHENGVRTIIGGEFEAELLALARSLGESAEPVPDSSVISLARLDFIVPDRSGLPPLAKYARLTMPDGGERVVGYTEASRGCKHRCRHCPIVPVYDGLFRVVQKEVVLEDIRRQVAAGAEHITFGDPDFLNGPLPAAQLVRALHREWPQLSYDVTIKVEHLLKHRELLPLLKETGCAFVTSAVEAVDDPVLALLDKGHTRADFERLVELMRDAGLPLSPTFVAFTPWTTLEGYADLLRTIAELGMVNNVAPVQLAIRLLIPAGSRLLELRDVQRVIAAFDPQALCYPWRNPDLRVDALQHEIEQLVAQKSRKHASRHEIFDAVYREAERAAGTADVLRQSPPLRARASIPYLTEPWYC
jgi:radical SAM superfamily enzyme YgiQ (UPF0313 family)